MRYKLTWIFVFMVASRLYSQKVSYIFVDVYFKTDKYKLERAEKEKIKSVLDTLQQDRIRMVQMAGHTDSRADSLYNIELSKKRATAAADYFVELGISKDKIKPGFFGENRPKQDNISETGFQKNRRVEIRITYDLPAAVTTPPVKKDTIPLTRRDTCANHDTMVQLSTGILLKMNRCNAQKLSNCVEVTTISDPEELLASGLSMRDERGSFLESDGMFSLQWNSRCSRCDDFSADWLLTKEEYEKLGFGFYEYDSTNGNWDNIPRKKIERVIINGEVFYKYKLDCSALAGQRFNKDRKLPSGDVYMKLKVKANWNMEYYESDTATRYFFATQYDTTENLDRKKVWKVPPMKRGTVGLRNRKTGEVVAISLASLKPARFKLLRHKLVTTYKKDEKWPHLNTAIVSIEPPKRNPKYFRKYKITRRIIRRAMR